jgi:hypothetical protein
MIPCLAVPNCPIVSRLYNFFKGPEPYMSSDVFEQCMRTVYMISLGVFKNSLCYLFPFVGGVFFNYRKMEPDNLYTGTYLDLGSVKQLALEVEFLEENAGLKKKPLLSAQELYSPPIVMEELTPSQSLLSPFPRALSIETTPFRPLDCFQRTCHKIFYIFPMTKPAFSSPEKSPTLKKITLC